VLWSRALGNDNCDVVQPTQDLVGQAVDGVVYKIFEKVTVHNRYIIAPNVGHGKPVRSNLTHPGCRLGPGTPGDGILVDAKAALDQRTCVSPASSLRFDLS
jgi:hypothetical protein